MYKKCGCIDEAENVFSQMHGRNVISWTNMIFAYVQSNQAEEARHLYRQMLMKGVDPDKVACIAILSACTNSAALLEGKLIHALIISKGYECDLVVGNALIDMYGKCGYVNDAHRILDKMPHRDVISWNSIIGAYVLHGPHQMAMELFGGMHSGGVQPDNVTFVTIIGAYDCQVVLAEGKMVHAYCIACGFNINLFVKTSLINMYGKCGSLEDARKAFNEMDQTNVISCTAMIAAYIRNGDSKGGLMLFRHMYGQGMQLNEVSSTNALNACLCPAFLADGKLIHAQISICRLSENVTVANALVGMYGKCGTVGIAFWIFSSMPLQDLVSWNTMITGCVQNDWHVEALHLFREMYLEGIFLDRISFTSILTACCSVKLLGDGKFIHACVIDSDLAQDAMVNTAIINMYGKCLHLEDAIRVFEETSEKDIVSWNAMIAVCVHNEHGIHAIEFFNEMQLQGMTPDRITFISVLDACANVAALNIGRQVHATLDIAYDSDMVIVNALLNMYGKCGSLSDANKTFRKMQGHDLLTWNTMITAYSQHGEANEVLQLLKKMHHEGVKPNNVTFISLLSAFGRAGSNTEGFFCLVCLSELYCIVPMLEHYGCITDQFGRLGKLDQAEECIIAMPFQANAMTWMTLLGACRVHGDEERGRRAAQHAFELDQQSSGAYVMLANIFAESAR